VCHWGDMRRLVVAVSMLVCVLACGQNPPAVGPLADAGSPPSQLDAGVDGGAVETDAGVLDAGTFDAGTFDAGGRDAGAFDAGAADAGRDPLVLARPFDVTVPVGYRPGTPTPLVVVLHGYTATAQLQDTYFGLSRLAQQRGFLVALPNGLRDAAGQQYWNATNACCAFGRTNDDVAYLTAVIRDVQARYSVDPRRIFLVGHSNGGFMSHRLACERAGLIAGIVSLAGAQWADASRCTPSSPVSVLQVHGTLDTVIAYGGGANAGETYPSAETTVKTWGAKNGCAGTALTRIGGDLNLVTALLGDETEREHVEGCPGTSAAELWTIRGGTHLPTLNESFAETIFTWLMAHPKP
jgi:polyhydroxybutyrate depolymerase